MIAREKIHPVSGALFVAIIGSLARSGPARVPLVRPHRRPPAMHRIGKAAIMRA